MKASAVMSVRVVSVGPEATVPKVEPRGPQRDANQRRRVVRPDDRASAQRGGATARTAPRGCRARPFTAGGADRPARFRSELAVAPAPRPSGGGSRTKGDHAAALSQPAVPRRRAGGQYGVARLATDAARRTRRTLATLGARVASPGLPRRRENAGFSRRRARRRRSLLDLGAMTSRRGMPLGDEPVARCRRATSWEMRDG